MSKRYSKNQIIYLYAACVALFAALAVCGVYVAERSGTAQPTTQHEFVRDMTYLDLPSMTIAIGSRGTSLARVDISLEVASKDLLVLEGYQPRITDKLNHFFASVRPEDMRRFSSQPWIRQELLREVNSVGAPVPVHDLMLQRLIIM